ncbi:predicted protein [Naegleria gruberi]|uniref:Predicted protein n=1 Tax=Naegleria gruberi TaxID=5762 RepID=D2VSP3_NAEGR|nr:uncharacterized protein NAEGRDRAFT_56305 [Naegleria gruberi]EFC40158.1 predicted protein [Naegleria gruberi]|eukprot:XP_002672902.1 predicted protein [Naegleria gruberi strain NEG-M]
MYSFATLYKPVKSILSTDSADKVSISVSTKANPDFSVAVRGARANADGKVESSLSWSQKLKQGGVAYTVNGSLDQDATVGVTVVASGVAKGLNADLSSKMKTACADNKVTGNLDYTAEKFHLTGNFDHTCGGALLLTATATAQVVEGLVVGGDAQIKALPKEANPLKKYTVGARYSMKNIDVATQLEDSLKKIRVGYAQKIDDSVSVAGEFAHELKSDKAPVFTLGTQYKIDSDSSIKANINTKGIANATYSLTVNPRLTTSISAEADVFAKNVSKVGLSINYSA